MDRRIVAAAAALIVLVTSAGAYAAFRPASDSAPQQPTAAVPPGVAKKQAFIAEADGLCSQALSRMKALTFPTTQTEALAYVTTGIAINRQLMTDLRALDAPKKDRRSLRKVLRSFDRAITANEDYLGAIRSGSPVAVANAEQRVLRLTTRANGWARAYGFGACAEGA